MAKAVISEKSNGFFRLAKTKNSFRSKIIFKSGKSKVENIVPFKIRFTNIGIGSSYGPGNAAPIGIAVIGINNYIM